MTQAIQSCVLALSVLGGLGVSMFLTLLVIPCVYLIISGAAERSKAWLTGTNSDQLRALRVLRGYRLLMPTSHPQLRPGKGT